ncbi:DNA polymerase III subunit gamma/tau [Ectothiorhodospira variabilis]|uniref:DNA polymerase III subunit gamma/tau n=1 Tax=Ectothiorhodospira variabilis TaxID=505694 RepID=UPI001EFBE09A|nr:DNA polymerase III subunit gamma/tau [Ectothiorhodospira variabilis]MCG5498159.1 DNA polymerase III subunit gamma/tau [Ectothiorhodospira variabilis]
MSYQVLARKWRPRTFEQLVGQPHVVRALSNALREDRLHHAYLFTGTRGVGKTTIARVLAKCLNCETGITAQPCGQCSACREIDEGRFIDLIEVDAASRTRVEDTRDLLENVPYAPTRGRFKVYLVDEVHMLSTHSFNALLKTLEEPPPHVKFLLATTDPQKLPVTVLSRCLQFNLKAMPPEMIQSHLLQLLEREGIQAESAAVMQVARAASGSMRDALSLLDQAIGFGGGVLREAEVLDMLGAISRDHLKRLLEALAEGDARELLAAVDALSEQAPDYGAVLGEVITLLHHLALVQQVPEVADSLPDDPSMLRDLASRLSPEDVQLFYQIALMGRRDLSLAPEPRAGMEMVLLRMLAFRPAEAAQPVAAATQTPSPVPAGKRPPASSPGPEPVSAPSSTPSEVTAAPSVPASGSGELDWPQLAASLGLGGIPGQLASHCALLRYDGGELVLGLARQHDNFRTTKAQDKLQEALRRHLGDEVKLTIQVGDAQGNTPAAMAARRDAERQRAAEQSIDQDRWAQGLKDQFDAELIPGSVRPRDLE